MKLEKAEIVALNNTGRVSKTIPVLYNPEELSASTSSDVSGQGSSLKFHRVKQDDFSVSLFFDSYEQKEDVRRYIKPIEDLMKPTVTEHDVKRPPVCVFRWGGFEYKGVIIKVERQFILFLPSGVPVRARVNVSIKSILTPKEELESMGREACRKFWTVREGDRLDLIASDALNDPEQWRLIARENQIANPLTFPQPVDIGRRLTIPDNV